LGHGRIDSPKKNADAIRVTYDTPLCQMSEASQNY